MEELLSGDDIEALPQYDEDEENEYLARTAPLYQVEDPFQPGSPLFTVQDLLTIAMIGYRALLVGEPAAQVLASVNEFRDMFYRGRLAMKYPHETSHDPKYQDGLEGMIEVYHLADPDYDPFTDGDAGARN